MWWNLTMPSLPAISPWSRAELLQLAGAGVALPDGTTLLAQAAQDWLRPVLAANYQLTLVLPPPHEESHPLWQMIEAVVQHPKVHALEELLLAPGPLCQPQPSVPLPMRKRWWKLPADIPLAMPEKASFSSLNLLLFNPYQWLLQYGAKIQPSKSLSLSDSFLLNGSLTHRLAEHFFNRADALTMNATDFDAWFSIHFQRVVREEGAVLLMEGRGADLATLTSRTSRAIASDDLETTRYVEPRPASLFIHNRLAFHLPHPVDTSSGYVVILDTLTMGTRFHWLRDHGRDENKQHRIEHHHCDGQLNQGWPVPESQ